MITHGFFICRNDDPSVVIDGPYKFASAAANVIAAQYSGTVYGTASRYGLRAPYPLTEVGDDKLKQVLAQNLGVIVTDKFNHPNYFGVPNMASRYSMLGLYNIGLYLGIEQDLLKTIVDQDAIDEMKRTANPVTFDMFFALCVPPDDAHETRNIYGADKECTCISTLQTLHTNILSVAYASLNEQTLFWTLHRSWENLA